MLRMMRLAGTIIIILNFCPISIQLLAQERADSTYSDPTPDAFPEAFSESGAGEEASDSTVNFQSSLDAYPYAFYTPETKLAFGGGGVFAFFTVRDKDLNPSKIVLSGYYSTIKTYEIFNYTNLYFRKNKVAANIDLAFSHTVDRYYGIGSNTPERGNEEYILENLGGVIDIQIPPTIGISDRSGLIIEYRHYKVADRKENPYLQNDTLNGIQGGNVSGLGTVIVWDRRDNVFFPNKGGLFRTKLVFYTHDLGSDYTFNWIEFDARRYWSFKPDHVVAFQLYLEAVGGKPPFYEFPALGGPRKMRGYFKGRYRDFIFFMVQLEYRQYIWNRLGVVGFLGVGDVVTHLHRLQIQHMKKSYGFGIRFLFNKEKKINLRADFGFGKGTSGVYFGMEEAF